MASITMSGLGSGLDYKSWIDALVGAEQEKIDSTSSQASAVENKRSALNVMKGYYTDLQESLNGFTSILEKDDIFNQKSVASNSDAIKATVDSTAGVQNLSISVSQLATSTVAKSSFTAAATVNNDTVLTDISSGSISEGTFSIYVNGKKNIIDIAKTDSFENVLEKFNNIEGVNATLADGKLSISSTDSSAFEISVGSSSDTSNFTNVMSLTRNSETGVYSSSKNIFQTNSSSALSTTNFSAGSVTLGTFTIGNEEFTIDESTTLDSLIKTINKSEAGINAYWDSNAGKMVLSASQEGAININIEAGTSNFTDIMGFTESTWDSDGAVTSSKLTSGSQTLGTNAVLSINGTTITSTSNTVTSDISGIKGLTLELNEETTNASVDVSQDTSSIVDAVNNFVSSFNKIMTSTETALNSETGTLKGESLLRSLRNTLRKTATSSVADGGVYNSLHKIGITTGAFSNDVNAATNELVVNSEKLLEALQNDPSAVKQLFVGTNSSEGVFEKMETSIENALNTSSGYFASREKTYKSEISSLNKKVSKMELSLENYQARLEAKFQAMDELISNMQNQASIFDSYFNTEKNDD